jgi:hypothetical protein
LGRVGSATNRATHYNTKEEQQKAVQDAHYAIFKLDRSVYALTVCLPGATDYARQIALVFLLNNKRTRQTFLTDEQEFKVIMWLTKNVAPHRLLNIFNTMRYLKINNSRTRRVILTTILGSTKLEFWSVKYRTMLRDALDHVWGQRMRGIILSILSKDDIDNKEANILKKNIDKYIHPEFDKAHVYECIQFIFREDIDPSLRLIKQYEDAKVDFKKGKDLPPTTLTGIRTQHHADSVSKEDEVRQSVKSGNMSKTEVKQVQKRAKAAGVKKKDTGFDPMKYDSVELYKYAFEDEITDDIQKALESKASRSADSLPVTFGNVGILVDTSKSMYGHDTQKNHPIAVALATRDMLIQGSESSSVIYSGYEDGEDIPVLPEPKGDTVLAEGLVALLQDNPDSIFILSDGYENCPAGRTAEVIHHVRRLGINTPIYQLSPVIAAESGGIRTLGPDVFSMPIRTPNGIGITLLKGMFEQDLLTGVCGLLNTTLPLIEGGT